MMVSLYWLEGHLLSFANVLLCILAIAVLVGFKALIAVAIIHLLLYNVYCFYTLSYTI